MNKEKKMLGSNGLPYLWANIKELIDENKGSQTDIMPEAGEANVGTIIQYVGETTEEYVQGYFYKCTGKTEEEVTTYVWESIEIQDDAVVTIPITIRGNSARMDFSITEENTALLALALRKSIEKGITSNVRLSYEKDTVTYYCYLSYYYYYGTTYNFVFETGTLPTEIYNAGTIRKILIMYDTSNWTMGYSIVKTITPTTKYVGRGIETGDLYSIQVLSVNNSTAYTPTGDYNPATKKYVDDAVATIPKFDIKVVDILPVEDISKTTVYLVPSNDAEGNLYTEYIYVDEKWEELGHQSADFIEEQINTAFAKRYSLVLDDEEDGNFYSIDSYSMGVYDLVEGQAYTGTTTYTLQGGKTTETINFTDMVAKTIAEGDRVVTYIGNCSEEGIKRYFGITTDEYSWQEGEWFYASGTLNGREFHTPGYNLADGEVATTGTISFIEKTYSIDEKLLPEGLLVETASDSNVWAATDVTWELEDATAYAGYFRRTYDRPGAPFNRYDFENLEVQTIEGTDLKYFGECNPELVKYVYGLATEKPVLVDGDWFIATDGGSVKLVTIGSEGNAFSGWRLDITGLTAQYGTPVRDETFAGTKYVINNEYIDLGIEVPKFIKDGTESGSVSAGYASARAYNSFAGGTAQTSASGDSSFAFGYSATASGLGSVAFGANSVASGSYSFAIGSSASATKNYSIAMGLYTNASGACQTVIGRNNIVDSDTKYAFIVGNGSAIAGSARSNAHTLDWSGNAWYKGTIKIGGTSYDDASEVATKAYVDSKASSGIDPTGSATISGTWAFSILPTSTATPTEDNQLVTKKYVDDLFATIVAMTNQEVDAVIEGE